TDLAPPATEPAAPPGPHPAGAVPQWRKVALLAGIALALGLLAVGLWMRSRQPQPDGQETAVTPAPTGPPIKGGIPHSRTGTMALSEKPVIDATLLAIEEINDNGGVLGRPVEAIVEDGASDWPTFARKAEKLITKDEVSVVFGCWTSASRKTVKPIFE